MGIIQPISGEQFKKFAAVAETEFGFDGNRVYNATDWSKVTYNPSTNNGRLEFFQSSSSVFDRPQKDPRLVADGRGSSGSTLYGIAAFSLELNWAALGLGNGTTPLTPDDQNAILDGIVQGSLVVEVGNDVEGRFRLADMITHIVPSNQENGNQRMIFRLPAFVMLPPNSSISFTCDVNPDGTTNKDLPITLVAYGLGCSR